MSFPLAITYSDGRNPAANFVTGSLQNSVANRRHVVGRPWQRRSEKPRRERRSTTTAADAGRSGIQCRRWCNYSLAIEADSAYHSTASGLSVVCGDGRCTVACPAGALLWVSLRVCLSVCVCVCSLIGLWSTIIDVSRESGWTVKWPWNLHVTATSQLRLSTVLRDSLLIHHVTFASRLKYKYSN